jgi:hypothetical protein
MLHACVERFDVIGGRGNILGWDGEVNKAIDKYLISARIQSLQLRKCGRRVDGISLLEEACMGPHLMNGMTCRKYYKM